MKMSAHSVSGEGILPGMQTAASLLCPHMTSPLACGEREITCVSSSSYMDVSPTRLWPHPYVLI